MPSIPSFLTPAAPRNPPVNLDALEDAMRPAPPVRHYAPSPPPAREPGPVEPVVDQIQSFGGLPTKEIDDIVAAAEAELANLKRDAQAVRDLYVLHTQRIANDIKRLREGVKLSMELMNELREQCIALDATAAPAPKKMVAKSKPVEQPIAEDEPPKPVAPPRMPPRQQPSSNGE